MAFTEDFAVFFADFGVTATPLVGDAVTVIFDRATIQTLGGDITSTGPIALAVEADVADWTSQSTVIEIGSASFLVIDKQPDGTGLTLLTLREEL